MSHFSTVKTELRQLEPLVKSLRELAASCKETHEEVTGALKAFRRGKTCEMDKLLLSQNS